MICIYVNKKIITVFLALLSFNYHISVYKIMHTFMNLRYILSPSSIRIFFIIISYITMKWSSFLVKSCRVKYWLLLIILIPVDIICISVLILLRYKEVKKKKTTIDLSAAFDKGRNIYTFNLCLLWDTFRAVFEKLPDLF